MNNLRDTHVSDLHAMLVGGVVPSCAGIGLRRHGEGAAGAAVHRGEVESVGEMVTLRFELPGDTRADVMRLALNLLPGRYRIGGLAIGSREIPSLSARRWEAVPRDGQDGWIHMAWDAGTCGPEIDVRGLLQGEPTVVRLQVARMPEDGSRVHVDGQALLARLEGVQLRLGAALVALSQRLSEVEAAMARELALASSGIGCDARVRSEALSEELALREARLHTALEALHARLERGERERADTIWRRLRKRLPGAA